MIKAFRRVAFFVMAPIMANLFFGFWTANEQFELGVLIFWLVMFGAGVVDAFIEKDIRVAIQVLVSGILTLVVAFLFTLGGWFILLALLVAVVEICNAGVLVYHAFK